jgi:uncharacterized glyoxalase superfamily protein PhnB
MPGEGQTIFPVLRYQDARSAIRWLCAVFGFTEVFAVPESSPSVRHAQLRLGTNIVMLGSVRPGDTIMSPRSLGAATQALCVYIPDVDAHYQHAMAAGAEITEPLRDTDFGSREYAALDLEGHPWTFGSYRPA